jgi:hypothetical protein
MEKAIGSALLLEWIWSLHKAFEPASTLESQESEAAPAGNTAREAVGILGRVEPVETIFFVVKEVVVAGPVTVN